MSPVYRACYCAFCKSPRKVYSRRHVGAKDILSGSLLGLSLGLLVWQELDARIIPIVVTMLGLQEIVTQIRWRISLVCKKCHFDPLLYLQSPEKAAQKVRLFLEEKKKNPNLLEPQLPVLQEQKARKKRNAAARQPLPEGRA